MRRGAALAGWLAGALLLAQPRVAAADQVFVVVDRETRAYRDAIAGIEEAGHRVERISATAVEVARRGAAAPADAIWLGMGPSAAKLLTTLPGTRRAALFVREQQVPAGVSAVTLEVPPAQQLAWIKAAFPGRRQVIVLRQRGGTAVPEEPLQQAAAALGLELVFASVTSSGDAVAAFEDAARRRSQSAVAWLLPDPIAINSDTIAPLIQVALAARMPVVGFSDYFLRVGALAAVTVDYRACGPQALRLAGGQAPRVEPPTAARLTVDGRLAERLGIAVAGGAGIEVQR
ncbi:MAG: hypothetical protein JXR83_19045 [Deltaproteobacteria bacterium]|nr:hypothetical protein [Deltaproteobacteria bacterium]